MPAFFKKELNAVQSQYSKLQLNYMYDQKLDTQIVDSKSLEKELHDFLLLDLNKSAYVGAFTRSELHPDSNTLVLHYEANQKGIDLNSFEIEYKNEEVVQLAFHFSTTNNLYESGKDLIYKTHKGFEIKGFQKTKFKDPVKYTIQVEYLP
ncbi:MAG: hypothetical protein ACOVP1_05940 [Bacteroidia bacterium]